MRAGWTLIGITALAAACGGGSEPQIEIGDDTLRMEVPDDAADRLERTGRRIGGKVGEAMEETGQAIQDAGRRVREEAGDSL